MDGRLAKSVLDTLGAQYAEMVALLERLVLAESPSRVPEAQQGVLTILFEALSELDLEVRLIPGRATGGQLYARPRRHRRGQPLQLLLGHCDTVWPIGTLKDMPLIVKDGCMHGPGVYDMKAGLVQVIFALKALAQLDISPDVTPVVLINTDEEIGSFESARLIRHIARRSRRAFVFEPSLGPEGKLKTTRKGVGRFTIEAQGKAAHAGLDPEAGASAILELSYAIQALFALNDSDSGVTVNVGQIEGGLGPNVIAPTSRAVVDVRVPTQAAAGRVEQAITSLQPTTPGVSLKVSGRMGRPPMESTPRNRELWALAQEAAAVLGLALEEGMAGGGSDGATTSLYTATLDGLGAVGDGAHAEHEFVYLDSLVERSALLALLLVAPDLRGSGLTKTSDAVPAPVPALEGQDS